MEIFNMQIGSVKSSIHQSTSDRLVLHIMHYDYAAKDYNLRVVFCIIRNLILEPFKGETLKI